MSTPRTALRLFSFVFATILAGAATPSRACTVSLGVPEYPPFAVIEDGKVSGVVAELTVLALRNMGCQVRPRTLPFARMYKWIHGGKIDVATSVRKTNERAQFAHYSVPVISEYQLIMVPKGQRFELRTLHDFADRDIGGQLGFLYPQLEIGGASVRRVRNFEINVNRVAQHRLDGTIIGSLSGPHISDGMALSQHVAYLPRALNVVHLTTALSLRAFNRTMRTRFDSEIRSLLAGRLWKEILAANNVPEKRKKWPLLATGPTP